MYELKNWRRFLTLTAMCAVMVFGYVGVGHIAVATDGAHTDHVAMQQSGSGHQLVVFDKFGGNGCGMVAITTDGHRIAPRPAGKTYFKDPMALMRPDNPHMETNSDGHGHRLSAKRTQGGHQVIAMAPRPTYGHNLRT